MWIVPKEGFATGVKRSLQSIHHHFSMAARIGARTGHNTESLKGIMDSLPPPNSFDDFFSPRSNANGTDLPQRKRKKKKTVHQTKTKSAHPTKTSNPNKTDQSKKTNSNPNQPEL